MISREKEELTAFFKFALIVDFLNDIFDTEKEGAAISRSKQSLLG